MVYFNLTQQNIVDTLNFDVIKLTFIVILVHRNELIYESVIIGFKRLTHRDIYYSLLIIDCFTLFFLKFY